MSIGMSKHANSSFDEAKAVRILAKSLESSQMIKTFFLENDRTPNYDGSFELISKSGEPKKQFIVQIKKSNSISICGAGKNAGKYVYSLDTSFLYYIKEKVVESPAFYFVVDIDNERIFYLYLSDELLMKLDFEGKMHVSYAFSENEILKDINEFCDKLYNISNERNDRLLINKTSEEIIEIQEAVDYINDLFNSDFKVIKNSLFPNLWRFGICYSKSSELLMGPDNDKESLVSFNNTNMFGLYPQIKGKINQDVKEYHLSNIYNYLDCGGKGKPIDYVKNVVHKMIKDFCVNPPSYLLPSAVLEEKVYKKASEFNVLFNDESGDLIVDEIINNINKTLSIFDYVLFGDSDRVIKEHLITKHNLIDICNAIKRDNSIDINKYYNNCNIKTDILRAYSLLSLDSKEFINDINELKRRGIKQIQYEWGDLHRILYNGDIYDIRNIISHWFNKLPNIYYEFYKNVFSLNNEYRYKCKVDYYIYDNKGVDSGLKYHALINKYKNEEDSIIVNEEYINSCLSDDKKEGLIFEIDTSLLTMMVYDQQLFYDGIRCMLYQGICQKLNFKIEGLNLNGYMNYVLFE